MTNLTRERETCKLEQAKMLRDIITNIVFPHIATLKQALDQIQRYSRPYYIDEALILCTSLDKNAIFRFPVTRAEAPDYYDIIKNPMCFTEIERKIEKGDYLDLDSFKVLLGFNPLHYKVI